MKKIIILSQTEINAVNGAASTVMESKDTNTDHLDYKSVVVMGATVVFVATIAINIIATINSCINYCTRDIESCLTAKKFELTMYYKVKNLVI